MRAHETQGGLLAKHKTLALDMGARAVGASLKNAGAGIDDIGHLCCVTTTGFLTPGLSALLIREMGIAPQCSRVDVVGMGCNGGLNALGVTAAWSAAHPRRLAVLLCAEACSAAYVFDSTMRTAVVNSLFGDGAAAIVLTGDDVGDRLLPAPGLRILSFASHIITDAVTDGHPRARQPQTAPPPPIESPPVPNTRGSCKRARFGVGTFPESHSRGASHLLGALALRAAASRRSSTRSRIRISRLPV